jgi:hypothetical protein
MKLELKWGEVLLLAIVVVLSIATNLPESWLGEYISREMLIGVLGSVVIIALFRYLRWMLFMMVVILAVGANMHEQLAHVVNIDPVVMLATLIMLVLVSILNHVFKLLPTEAASKRADNAQSRQAVLEAVRTGNLNKLKHLLQLNVEVDFLQDGTSPAHIVAEQGNNEMMQALLNYGTKMNVLNKDGLTPMEVAMAFGFKHTVEILRSSGEVDLAVS